MFQFNSEQLPLVLARLERYYGVSIEQDPAVSKLRCTGKLVLFDNLHDVLQVIAKSVPIAIEKRDETYFVSKK